MGRFNHYTQEARQALSFAREEAKQLRRGLVGPEHILLGILDVHDPLIENLCLSFHLNPARLRQSVEFVSGRGNKALLSEPSMNQVARTVLARAEQEAADMQAELVDIAHLLLGLLGERPGKAVGVLESFGLSLDPARQRIMALLNNEYGGQDSFATEYQIYYDATPLLNQMGHDLTLAALAGRLDPVIGREAELERTLQILLRRSKSNPLLIGSVGVGKTAIVEGLAQRIVQGLVPEALQHCRVVALDLGLLMIDTQHRGDFEERLQRLLREVLAAPKLILVVDELHSFIKMEVTAGSISTAHLLKPLLEQKEFRCIGATTLRDYHKTIEADPALERRFQPVLVAEPSMQETLEILRGLRMRYADFHRVTVTDEALRAAVQLSSRYVQGRFQPDKALDLLDEAASRVWMQHAFAPKQLHHLRVELLMAQRAKDEAIGRRDYLAASRQRVCELQQYRALCDIEQAWEVGCQRDRPVVGKQQVAEVVAITTGIPGVQLIAGEADHLLKLEEKLHKRIVEQHEAVQAVARAVRRAWTNLRDERRPIGSFIFAGPPGVGKTELARALAAVLLGDERALLKLDMSEFTERHHIARLISAPPGNIGHDQAGQLTEAVRMRPYSIVLFDEIEKAHPQVLDLLLQILEDGSLTDAQGQVVDFKHSIIILASSVGTTYHNTMAFSPIQYSEQERRVSVHHTMCQQGMSALKELFKPELLNRVDEVLFFHALEREHLRQLVDLMIEQTQQRLVAQSIELEVTDSARWLLVEHGYDPLRGARPLRRAVESMLNDVLVDGILRGEFGAGETVVVDVDSDMRKCVMCTSVTS